MAYEEPLGAKARRVFGNLLSFRGRERLTSWGVAGVLAYALFYLPEQRKQEQIKLQRAYAKERAIELGLEEIDRAKPIADPQDSGLIKGTGAVRKQEAAKAAAAAVAGEQR